MKVIVNVCYSGAKVSTGEGHGKRLSLAVKLSDTVLRLKQRVMLVEPVSFPQVLLLDGEALQDSQRLEELGLSDGQELQFLVTATVDVFTQQLVDLLKAQARAVPANELALLYSHKCGGTVKGALAILGCHGTLVDFLTSQKPFSVQEGLVSLVEPPSTPIVETPVTVTAAVVVKSTLGNVVKASVDLKVKASQTVQNFYDRVAAAELIPFQASKVSVDGQVLEGCHRLGSYIKEGATLEVSVNISKDMLLQQLTGVLNGRRLSVTELGDLYCYRYGVPVTRSLELLGRRSTLKEFLKDNAEHFEIHAGSVVQKEPSNTTAGATFGPCGLNQQYLDLDSEIASCKSIQEAEACLEVAIASATRGSSLAIARVIRGGSLGRGTAFKGNADAEALLLVNGMESMDRTQWLPPLLTKMALALSEDLQGKADVSVAEDSVQISFPGSGFRVSLSLDAVSSSTALAADRRARLFAKMSPATKVTMRLLKWWRNQQVWSNGCRPSDLVLEELVASIANTSPEDQAQAVAAVLVALQSSEQQACKAYFDNHQLVQFATQSAGKLIK